jgi:hypothetical protein
MADTTSVFLKRTGLIRAPELRATCRADGLDRTTTVFGQQAWLDSDKEVLHRRPNCRGSVTRKAPGAAVALLGYLCGSRNMRDARSPCQKAA